MSREEIIIRLRQNEAMLRQRGVAHAGLFGSRARGDQRVASDTDIMIELDPAARVTIFDYAGLKDFIASLFDGQVDVVNRDALKPHVKPGASARGGLALSSARSLLQRLLSPAKISKHFGTTHARSMP